MLDLIKNLPKAELHLHLEGTLEPDLLFRLARQNRVSIPYSGIDEIKAAYQFTDLQSFLDVYYQGAGVLLQEQDFYDLSWAYLERAHQDNIVHTEVFFDPQTHTERGIAFEVVIGGIRRALDDANRKFGMTSRLIMCFLRHLSEASAIETLEQALPHRSLFHGVGLDSSEKNNPPEKFANVYRKAKKEGLKLVAHAGEEGPPKYIWDSIRLLEVERIDHGIACEKDPELIDWLAASRMPLTVCPLSNIKLRVFDSMQEHNILRLLDSGLCVTVNSDDPSYFGGYLNDNYRALYESLHMSRKQLEKLVCNSFEASWMDVEQKRDWQEKVSAICSDRLLVVSQSETFG